MWLTSLIDKSAGRVAWLVRHPSKDVSLACLSQFLAVGIRNVGVLSQRSKKKFLFKTISLV